MRLGKWWIVEQFIRGHYLALNIEFNNGGYKGLRGIVIIISHEWQALKVSFAPLKFKRYCLEL